MLHLETRKNVTLTAEIIPFLMPSPDLEPAEKLGDRNTQEVLDFLSQRPVHTVVMTSYIIDNGIESELNRGKFYGSRNREGNLEGVALIGHTTLVEARTDNALRALAIAARNPETPIHLVMSSGKAAEDFWQHMTNGLREPRLKCTEELFETAFPLMVSRSVRRVENAHIDDLVQVAEAQAEVAFMESGVDPMISDREGFLRRVARRIEQKRVFVVRDNGNVIFKADIVAQTESVIYLEGVYVSAEHRGQGLGADCLRVLMLELLGQAENICLLSNRDLEAAHKCFVSAGMKNTGQCTTLFV
jgi:predicted GNAT family acetyltransferase